MTTMNNWNGTSQSPHYCTIIPIFLIHINTFTYIKLKVCPSYVTFQKRAEFYVCGLSFWFSPLFFFIRTIAKKSGTAARHLFISILPDQALVTHLLPLVQVPSAYLVCGGVRTMQIGCLGRFWHSARSSTFTLWSDLRSDGYFMGKCFGVQTVMQV